MPTPENPIIERIDTPVFSESLTNLGVSTIPANVTQVNDDKGKPLITTEATESAKIQLPGDRSTLLQKAKGSITDAATWLARFMLRLIAKEGVPPQSGGI